jgi:Domain of unknown function (DUF397)
MEHRDEIEFRKSTFSEAGNRVEVGSLTTAHGQVVVRDSKHRGGPVLRFTQSEWYAFVSARANTHQNTPSL